MTRDDVLTEFGSVWPTSPEESMADEIVRLRSQIRDLTNHRDAAVRQLDEFARAYREQVLAERTLRNRLDAAVATRDAAFALAAVEAERDATERMSRHHAETVLEVLARLNRAEAILAALREPSEAVFKATAGEMYGIDVDGVSSGAEAMYRAAALRVIRAAVAAAEQEVGQ